MFCAPVPLGIGVKAPEKVGSIRKDRQPAYGPERSALPPSGSLV